MKLQHIYEQLKKLYLTSNYSEFSTKWCKRSCNYLSDTGIYRNRHPSISVLNNIVMHLDYTIHCINRLPRNLHTSFQVNIDGIINTRNMLARQMNDKHSNIKIPISYKHPEIQYNNHFINNSRKDKNDNRDCDPKFYL